ncbi:hypothetical protein Tco_0736504 [Tanacetum coccineum]
MLEEANWSEVEDDLTKPRSLEKKMSKSARPDNHFYNSDFYNLAYLSMEKRYTSSLTKHYAARLEKRFLHSRDRTDGKEYEFSFADFSRLSLNDIKDMYLLKVQGKRHHLKLEYEIDFINALLLYIRRVVIKNRIKDTQLDTIHDHWNRKGSVYLNKYDVKSLMLHEEVHKFCDGTLVKVQDNLENILKENRLGPENVNLDGKDGPRMTSRGRRLCLKQLRRH